MIGFLRERTAQWRRPLGEEFGGREALIKRKKGESNRPVDGLAGEPQEGFSRPLRKSFRFHADYLIFPLNYKPSVRAEHLPGDEVRPLARQKEHGARDVLRGADHPERRLLAQRGAGVFVKALVHFGIHHSGRDAVDGDPARPQLLSQRLVIR